MSTSKGKGGIKATLRNALQHCFSESKSRLSEFARPLIYTGFNPVIGFSIKGIDENFREKIINSNMPDHKIEDFMYFLNRYEEVQHFERESWIDLETYLYDDIEKLTLLQIFME